MNSIPSVQPNPHSYNEPMLSNTQVLLRLWVAGVSVVQPRPVPALVWSSRGSRQLRNSPDWLKKASRPFQRKQHVLLFMDCKSTAPSFLADDSPTFTVTPVAHQFAAPPEVTATVQLERVDEAVQTLQQPAFFTQGTYAQAVEWTSTTISTFLIDFLTLTDDTRYFDQFVAFYKKQPVCNLLFQQFDDQMWVVLTYLRAAAYAKNHNTKWVKPFLRRAKLFYCLVRRGWDNKTCGGGMYWGPRSTYKNAVTTELYITTSMGMYEIYHKKEMLDAAIRGWVWFKNSGMINAQGLVNDGLDNTCKYGPYFSTDTGIMVKPLGLTTKGLYCLVCRNCTNTLETNP